VYWLKIGGVGLCTDHVIAAIDVNVNQPKPESEGGCQC
jgi:hypothetical protein